MMPLASLAISADGLAALGVVVGAALYLASRALRMVRPSRSAAGGACACPSASACGTGGPALDDLRRAAARGAARVNPGGGPSAR